jgi:hypothetical protein
MKERQMSKRINRMTVQDLIDELKEIPKEALVKIDNLNVPIKVSYCYGKLIIETENISYQD